jgi:hypothetical protein
MTPERTRLTKRHVEVLLRDYDSDPVGALTVALRIVLRLPQAGWDELVGATGLGADRRRALVAGETAALDELLAELNERRDLPI